MKKIVGGGEKQSDKEGGREVERRGVKIYAGVATPPRTSQLIVD